jgi:hypothetical protein
VALFSRRLASGVGASFVALCGAATQVLKALNLCSWTKVVCLYGWTEEQQNMGSIFVEGLRISKKDVEDKRQAAKREMLVVFVKLGNQSRTEMVQTISAEYSRKHFVENQLVNRVNTYIRNFASSQKVIGHFRGVLALLEMVSTNLITALRSPIYRKPNFKPIRHAFLLLAPTIGADYIF